MDAPEYQLDFKDGVWGMWAESFDWNQLNRVYKITRLLKRVRINNTVLNQTLEVPRPALISQLPKQRRFFSFPMGTPTLDKETHKVVWVGHLGCLPKQEAIDRLLSVGYPPNLLVAVCDTEKEELVLTVHIQDDYIVPVNCCCDIFHN